MTIDMSPWSLQELPDGTFALVDAVDGLLIHTTALGAGIVKMMQDRATLDDVVACLSTQYPVSADVVRHDVVAFIVDLTQRVSSERAQR